jgi:hypothetical protein
LEAARLQLVIYRLSRVDALLVVDSPFRVRCGNKLQSENLTG